MTANRQQKISVVHTLAYAAPAFAPAVVGIPEPLTRTICKGGFNMNWPSIFQVIGVNLLIVNAFFVLIWALSVLKKDASIVDIFWGMGFILVAAVSVYFGDGWTGRSVLVLLLTLVWGLRLSIHILIRNWGKGEDFRYQKFRNNAGDKFWITSLYNVFLLQAMLLLIIAFPIMFVGSAPFPRHIVWTDLLGTALWMTGFIFEALGDLQLKRFLAEPENRGQVMKYGLWRYTRHPNYFGETLIWWGIFCITPSAPHGWMTIIGPILITFMLLKVSGVTMLEEDLKGRREGYAEYVRNTSAFIPWFPKR